MAQLSKQEAKERAGRFCAFRERSPNEVLIKVKSWGLSEAEADTIVAELLELNYINEQRFANAYCHDKFEFNSWGKQKIKAGIYSHRLPERVVMNALDRIDQKSYEARLLALARRKWEKLSSEEEMKRKQKVLNYLANKGFELDPIWKTIAILEKEQRS